MNHYTVQIVILLNQENIGTTNIFQFLSILG